MTSPMGKTLLGAFLTVAALGSLVALATRATGAQTPSSQRCWFDSIAELASQPDTAPADPAIGGPAADSSRSQEQPANSDEQAIQHYQAAIQREQNGPGDLGPFGQRELHGVRAQAIASSKRASARNTSSTWGWVDGKGEVRAQYVLSQRDDGTWVVMEEHVVIPDHFCTKQTRP